MRKKVSMLLLALVAFAGTVSAAKVKGGWWCTSGNAYVVSVKVNGTDFPENTKLEFEAGAKVVLTVESSSDYYQIHNAYFLRQDGSFTLTGIGRTTSCEITIPHEDFSLGLQVKSLGYVVKYYEGYYWDLIQEICYDYNTWITVKAPSDFTPPLRKAGHRFVAWKDDRGTVYKPGDKIWAENEYSRNGKALMAIWEAGSAENDYDLNGDGTVNVGDVTLLVSAVLSGKASAGYDLNGDGTVNVGDVTTLVGIVLSAK